MRIQEIFERNIDRHINAAVVVGDDKKDVIDAESQSRYVLIVCAEFYLVLRPLVTCPPELSQFAYLLRRFGDLPRAIKNMTLFPAT